MDLVERPYALRIQAPALAVDAPGATGFFPSVQNWIGTPWPLYKGQSNRAYRHGVHMKTGDI